MAKNNIRSFRYSDRVSDILESMEGKSLNEKFENLVITCYEALPDVQENLTYYRMLVNEERDRYYDLVRHKDSLLRSIQMIEKLEEFLGNCNTIIPAAPADQEDLLD